MARLLAEATHASPRGLMPGGLRRPTARSCQIRHLPFLHSCTSSTPAPRRFGASSHRSETLVENRLWSSSASAHKLYHRITRACWPILWNSLRLHDVHAPGMCARGVL